LRQRSKYVFAKLWRRLSFLNLVQRRAQSLQVLAPGASVRVCEQAARELGTLPGVQLAINLAMDELDKARIGH
jgi:hypothetical protein